MSCLNEFDDLLPSFGIVDMLEYLGNDEVENMLALNVGPVLFNFAPRFHNHVVLG